MALNIGLVCSKGLERKRGGRLGNEDNYLVCSGGEARYRRDEREVVESAAAEGTLLAMADGFGGGKEGELAATAVVRILPKVAKRELKPPLETQLGAFLEEAHHVLRERALSVGPVQMGVALSVGWIRENCLHWAHVGDTRLYHCRYGRIQQLTVDHDFEEMERRAGTLSRGEGSTLAQSLIGGLRGGSEEGLLSLDPLRDMGNVELQAEDLLIFCTLGVSEFVGKAQLADLIRREQGPQALAIAMVECARQRGCRVNASILIALVEPY